MDVNASYVLLALLYDNDCKPVACGELLVTKGLQRLWNRVASGPCMSVLTQMRIITGWTGTGHCPRK